MDRLGRRREFGYDNDNRMTSETWFTDSLTQTQVQSWTYGEANRMKSAVDPDGEYHFLYDAAGRLTQVFEPYGQWLVFGYDGANNRTSVVDSQGGVTTIVFDELNRQKSEQVKGANGIPIRFDYEYDKHGLRESLTRYSDLNGKAVVATTEYTHDDDGRLEGLKITSGTGTVLADNVYAYDKANRVTSKTEAGTTTSYDYDKASQLTQDGSTTFSYDATGNRTNAGYATSKGNRITTDGVWTFTHDAEGNVTKKSKGASDETWVYVYDNRNQMTSAVQSDTDGGAATQSVTYVYDSFGNRIENIAWNGTTTLTQRYAMDGWDPAKPTPVGSEQFDTWAQFDESDDLVRRRVTGTGFNEQIARQTPAGLVNWYLTDQQGSVRQVIDNSVSVVASSNFDAYGNLMSGSLSDRFGFQGMEFDAVTGDYFDRARVYDPSIGQFLGEDLKFPGSGANAFLYAGNGPTNASDPSGMDELVTDQQNFASWSVASWYSAGGLFNIGNGSYNIGKKVGSVIEVNNGGVRFTIDPLKLNSYIESNAIPRGSVEYEIDAVNKRIQTLAQQLAQEATAAKQEIARQQEEQQRVPRLIPLLQSGEGVSSYSSGKHDATFVIDPLDLKVVHVAPIEVINPLYRDLIAAKRRQLGFTVKGDFFGQLDAFSPTLSTKRMELRNFEAKVEAFGIPRTVTSIGRMNYAYPAGSNPDTLVKRFEGTKLDWESELFSRFEPTVDLWSFGVSHLETAIRLKDSHPELAASELRSFGLDMALWFGPATVAKGGKLIGELRALGKAPLKFPATMHGLPRQTLDIPGILEGNAVGAWEVEEWMMTRPESLFRRTIFDLTEGRYGGVPNPLNTRITIAQNNPVSVITRATNHELRHEHQALTHRWRELAWLRDAQVTGTRGVSAFILEYDAYRYANQLDTAANQLGIWGLTKSAWSSMNAAEKTEIRVIVMTGAGTAGGIYYFYIR